MIPETSAPGRPFAELPVHPALLAALEARGYRSATPVQAAVATAEAGDRDLLVSARTGSGKTVAFGLALGGTLLGDGTRFPPGPPKALVVAPTRELALQVQTELAWLFAPTGARVASCVGGTDIGRELRALQYGAGIVVGTPGRLCDHLDRRSLDLSALGAVVLDEADEMLDMGFREELERILAGANPARRTLLFSATLPAPIVELARKYQKDPLRLAVDASRGPHADIEYRAHLIAVREREHAVVNTLRLHDPSAALVFVATRDSVNHLHANLVERGFPAVALSGELSQAERTRAVKALRDGRARVLVCTDVAARGLDLPDVSLVIHADLPHDSQVLQHRSGRTGRAGRKGVSVVLAAKDKRATAERLLRGAGVKVAWTPVANGAAVRALDHSRLVQDIQALAAEPSEEDVAVARELLQERSPEALVAALVAVQRARLPAAEDLPQTEAMLAQLEAKKGVRVPYTPPGRALEGSPSRPEDLGFLEDFADRPKAPRGDRPVRALRPPADGTEPSWFTVNVGRGQGADPRWLLPILCRRGKVTKEDLGRIQILPDETRVEVRPHAAPRFAESVRVPDKTDPNIRITPSSAPTRAQTTRPPRSQRALEPRVEAPATEPASTPAGKAPPQLEKKAWRAEPTTAPKGAGRPEREAGARSAPAPAPAPRPTRPLSAATRPVGTTRPGASRSTARPAPGEAPPRRPFGAASRPGKPAPFRPRPKR